MDRDRLTAIVVMALTIGASAFFAKRYALPELYAVCGLLLYFLGGLTGSPTQKRIERKLRKLPPAQLDQLYERISGRPPRSPRQPEQPSPVRLDDG